jgi:hypothetical protein
MGKSAIHPAVIIGRDQHSACDFLVHRKAHVIGTWFAPMESPMAMRTLPSRARRLRGIQLERDVDRLDPERLVVDKTRNV